MALMGTVTQRQGRVRLECDVEKGNGKAPQTAKGDGRAKEIGETSREGIATKRKERDATARRASRQGARQRTDTKRKAMEMRRQEMQR